MGDWCLPVAAVALGDAARAAAITVGAEALPLRAGWGTPRMESGVKAGFCGRGVWPCRRGRSSWQKYLLGVSVSVPSFRCCLLPAVQGRQRCSGLWHHLGGEGRNFKDWQLCLKMQKLRLFRSRNPRAFTRETLHLLLASRQEGFCWQLRAGSTEQACVCLQVLPPPGLSCAGLMNWSVAACWDSEHLQAAAGGWLWSPVRGAGSPVCCFVTKLRNDGLSQR